MWFPYVKSLICKVPNQPDHMPEIMKLGAFGEASLSYDRKWPKLKDLSKMPLQS